MSSLYFTEPAASWNNGIPVGNGYLGAMVFGKTDRELICMNEDSLWSGAPMERENPDALEYLPEIRRLLKENRVEEAQKLAERCFYSKTPHARHYQPLGQVWLQFESKGEINDYHRSLNLEQAVGEIRYEKSDQKYRREFFASNPANVFVYHIQAEQSDTFSFEAYVTRRDIAPGRSVSYVDDIVCENQIIYLNGCNGELKNGLEFYMAVSVDTDGCLKQLGTRLIVERASWANVYVTGRTSFRSAEPKKWCRKTLESAMEFSYEQIKEEHIRDYRKYYDRMHLRLGYKKDTKLSTPERLKEFRAGNEDASLAELYFNFGRYLLIASSREGSLPANLQGIWNYEFDPPWGSKYTININIQMNYWLAEKAGLSELHMPLLEHQKRMLPKGQRIAKKLYGVNGMCAHHNTDIWGDCAPTDYYIPATIWPMGGAWLALHIYEHYQYTGDLEFLKEYVDILEENVRFLLEYMFTESNGYYVTGPSVSPENTYITENGEQACVCMGPAMDIQIAESLFRAYLGACEDLGRAGYCKEVRERLEKLPPIRVGSHGQIMEWQEDYKEKEPGHRHISQLFALYPGSLIRPDKTPKLAQAAYQTLERRRTHGGGYTGWSCAWMIHFYARLWSKEKAYEMIRKLFAQSTLDNLLDNHPPFQIDGNFGGANGILEMLVQDYETEIYLLPALPEQWKEGELEGLCLKAQGTLSLAWEDGKLKRLNIYPRKTVKLMIHYEGKQIETALTKNISLEVGREQFENK